MAISAYLLWHKAFKNYRYTEGYVCEFLKSFYYQHLSTPHPQKSLNSGIIQLQRENIKRKQSQSEWSSTKGLKGTGRLSFFATIGDSRVVGDSGTLLISDNEIEWGK
jgi:hypothetical protein